ncbi:MAG: WD40 repeat domain-containing protein [Planctomycetes bacterium]|nr:WD40 repeat domain-containing protein [Planctomycetota bacterium]
MPRSFRVIVVIAYGLLAVVIGALPAPGQAGKKAGIPSKDAVAKAEALIGELYKDELNKAQKDPRTRGALALTFLQEARDTNDDPAGRYVLLQKALALASQAGDGPAALQAIEELAIHYTMPVRDVFAMKIKALAIASNAAASADAYQTVVDSALLLLEDSLAIDDFPSSLELTRTAENAAKKLRNVALVSAIRKRHEDVLTLQKHFAHWQPFADRLAKNADDAEANTEMGKYQGLLKGNWDLGLPLLSKGADAKLKALAAGDLAEPKASAKQAELAAMWQELAGNFKDVMRVHALLRAYSWYQQALAGAPLADVPGIEERLKIIMDSLPAEYRVGDIVTEIRRLEGHLGPVYTAAFSPDGKKIVSGGADASVRIWDAKSGKEQRRLEGNNGRVWTVAFAPDGRHVASGGFDKSIRIWDLTSARESRRLQGHDDYVRSVVFSGDGHFILSGGDDRKVRFWNANDGKEVLSFPGHNHFVWSVALSRDGRRALSASLDKTIRLWDVESGTELKKLEGHKDTVLCVFFSPDGRRALSGSTDKTLKLWDLESGKVIVTFTGHDGYVNSVAFSPDGRHVLSGSQDGTVRLWDAHTGKELRKLEGHRDQVWCVAFSRDGRYALSAGEDKTIRIWGGSR